MKSYTKLAFIYGVAVLGYALLVSRFTIPVHLNVDEELYISMARSFHYEGVFAKENEILNYSCVLYSVLLSFAYYFFSPEHIMFALRMIGVLVMLSSVFPIYLLGKLVLHNDKDAIGLSVFSCILPSMMSTAYCMQEVLSYPLFLWLIYVICREIEKEKLSDISRETYIIAMLCVLCYFTKTYMIFLPIVYSFLIIFDAYTKKQKDAWKKIILFLALWAALYLMGKECIFYVNNGIEGANHYSGQFSNLFPITFETITSAISCMSFYLVALMFYWGVLPIVLPLANLKKYCGKDFRFLLLVFLSFLVLIAEVVISIVLTEEGNVLLPHKVLYRYFQVLEIPLLLLFVKEIKNFKMPKYIWGIYTVVFSYMIIYYIYIGERQRTSIIDAPVFLLMENIDRYIVPHFNIHICVFAALIVLCAYLFYRWGKLKDIAGSFLRLSLGVLILFLVINIIQFPLFTNVIANGSKIQQDAIVIADYYEENKEKYANVYFIETEQNRYERAVYAYFPVDVICISEDEMESLPNKDSLFIAQKEFDVDELLEIDKELQVLQVFIKK